MYRMYLSKVYIWINVKYYWQTRQFDIGNPYPDPKVLYMILSSWLLLSTCDAATSLNKPPSGLVWYCNGGWCCHFTNTNGFYLVHDCLSLDNSSCPWTTSSCRCIRFPKHFTNLSGANYPNPTFFPKDVSSQGSSEDCWRISHHTYPTHIHHTTHIPHKSIQNVSHQYVSHQYVSVQHVSHQYVSNAMRIRSKGLHQQVLQYVSHQYVSHQYVSVQHISHQYASMPCVSIQCVSIQKVCTSRNRKRIPPIHIPPIRIFNTYPTSTDPFNAYPFKKCASAGMAMSMSIIAFHFIPLLLLGGNGNQYRNLAYPSISLQYY